MPRTLTDEQFIAAWGDNSGNARRMAAATGMTERAIKLRRRALEERYRKPLHAGDAARSKHYRHLQPREHKARHALAIERGTVLVFSDAHFWPGVRTTAFRALLRFIDELKPAAVICNGDAFDGASISRWPRIGWDSRPTVKDELRACQCRLHEIEAAAGDARLLWPLGNHDARFETRLAQVASEFEGLPMFHLKDHFPAWRPCWSVWINDDTVVKHRWKGGVHATRNNTLNSGKTLVTGHLHSLKVAPLTDYSGTRWGVDTGTLADPNGPQFIDYTEDGPKDWRSGFVVLTYWRSRLLTPETVQVLDERHVDFRGHAIEVPQ